MPIIGINELNNIIRGEEKPRETFKIKIVNGRCNAHLYRLHCYGNDWFVYQCTRDNCRHNVPVKQVIDRTAQCPECRNIFNVKEEHFLNREKLKNYNEALETRIICCKDKTSHTVKEDTSWLEEE